MFIRSLLIVLVAAILAANASHAQLINDSFTYQGTLNDGGVPANGPYDININVFDSAVGGNLIPGGSDSFILVPVTDGLFEVFVDFNTTGSIFDSNQTRWLQVSIRENGGPNYIPLLPRQRIAPAPLSNYALRSGYAIASGNTLQEVYDNGAKIIRDPGGDPIDIRSSSPTTPAQLNLGSTNGDEGAGELVIFSRLGSSMFSIFRDPDTGGGAFLRLNRNESGDAGFIIDGNLGGTESAQVSIHGPDNTIQFITGALGDDTVIVPVDAINAAEILNEVGAAEVADSSGTVLTEGLAAVDVLNSVTISAPADGYVLVLASAEFTVSHISGTNSSINIGVSNSPASFASNTDLELNVPSNAPNGLYEYPITTHAIFPASQGLNTYYFLADKDYLNGGVQVLDRQLSAIYIPTAYGSLARQHTQPNTPDERSPGTAPMTSYDIIMEQNAALQADNDRQQRELDTMKLQVQQLIEQSQRDHAQQSQD